VPLPKCGLALAAERRDQGDDVTIPATVVGSALAPITTVVEQGRLRFFAEAIGETAHRFVDVDAAASAGYPDLPVPPTFLFGLKLVAPEPFRWLAELGVDLRFVLHGAQRFEYHRMAFAGDVLQFRPRISDAFQKKGGSLEFLVVETAVTRGPDTIATLVETIIIRHPELAVA
jgi:N-terminal half of MaoC dehydratase